jgi:hypothetical protein
MWRFRPAFDQRGLERHFRRLAVMVHNSAKKDLGNPLSALIEERGSCAQLLFKPYERGTYEATATRFVELQS